MTDAPRPAAGEGYPGEQPQLLLLIDRDANRQQLAAWLTDRFAIASVTDGSIEAALGRCDLCLVDTRSLRRHRRALEAARDAASPEFLPVLLVLTEGELASLDADVWSSVDDVVPTPVRQAELGGRIGVLLRARGYSRALKRRNDRLEQFAGTVSHDLRNPLTIASGFLDSARETGEAVNFDRVERALDRMEAIIDDLLTLARSGTTIDERESVDLMALADAAWEAVETPEATLEVVADGASYEGDASQLHELLVNLFRNAVEHAGGDVTVRVGALPDDKGFFVEDDGPGVPAGERNSVFEYGVTTVSNGTGFGLAIVRGIVEAHEWSIRLTDGAKGGARFEIRTDPDEPLGPGEAELVEEPGEDVVR